jgi:RHS repeat-associated protein
MEFSYNGLGVRVRTAVLQNGTLLTAKNTIWCDRIVCEQRDTAGQATRREYSRSATLPSGVRLFAEDHLGSRTDALDGGGALVGRFAFDPWGRRSIVVGNDEEPEGFTGHEWAPVADLTETAFRVFDAEIGRWLSEDPLGLAGGPKLYTYVSNRPVVWDDPLGLAPGLGSFTIGGCIAGYQAFFHYASPATIKQVGDKVAHCMAHCELQKGCGTPGRMDSLTLAYAKEIWDGVRGTAARVDRKVGIPYNPWLPFLDDASRFEWDDIRANREGRTCPTPQSCWDRCKGAQGQFNSGKYGIFNW